MTEPWTEYDCQHDPSDNPTRGTQAYIANLSHRLQAFPFAAPTRAVIEGPLSALTDVVITGGFMQPEPQRSKIFREEHLASGRKVARIASPFRGEIRRMFSRRQGDPVRAIDTVTATDPTADPIPLLTSTRSIASHLAERITAHRELGVKTGLHQLPRRLAQRGRVNARDHPTDEGRAFLLGHAPRFTPFAWTQRRRQAAIVDQLLQLKRQPRNFPRGRRHLQLCAITLEDRNYDGWKISRSLGHANEPAPNRRGCQ